MTLIQVIQLIHDLIGFGGIILFAPLLQICPSSMSCFSLHEGEGYPEEKHYLLSKTLSTHLYLPCFIFFSCAFFWFHDYSATDEGNFLPRQQRQLHGISPCCIIRLLNKIIRNHQCSWVITRIQVIARLTLDH